MLKEKLKAQTMNDIRPVVFGVCLALLFIAVIAMVNNLQSQELSKAPSVKIYAPDGGWVVEHDANLTKDEVCEIMADWMACFCFEDV